MKRHTRLIAAMLAMAAIGIAAGPMQPRAARAAVLDYVLIKNDLKHGFIHYRIEKWPVGNEQGCLPAGATHGDHFVQRIEYVELKAYESANCSGRPVAQSRFPFRGDRGTYAASGSTLDPAAIHFSMRDQ